MDNYMKSPYAKRYIIEDSIPKVTSDGEPHEMMTLVAGLSGMFAAIVILGILVTLVGCKQKKRQRTQESPSPSSPGIVEIPEMSSQRSSILPLFKQSISMEDNSPRLISVSVISNLNQAFVASEMCLGPKKDKDVTSFNNSNHF